MDCIRICYVENNRIVKAGYSIVVNPVTAIPRDRAACECRRAVVVNPTGAFCGILRYGTVCRGQPAMAVTNRPGFARFRQSRYFVYSKPCSARGNRFLGTRWCFNLPLLTNHSGYR